MPFSFIHWVFVTDKRCIYCIRSQSSQSFSSAVALSNLDSDMSTTDFLCIEEMVLETNVSIPVKATVKRYHPPQRRNLAEQSLVLIFAHGTGFRE